MLLKHETNRLDLKVLDAIDAPKVLAFYHENRAHFEAWEFSKSEAFFTLGYHQRGLSLERQAHLRGQLIKFWLFGKNEETPIGMVGLSHIIRGPFQSCFLGYKIDHRHVNQGYATEAIEKTIEIAFDAYALHRIEAYAMPKNKASMRVLEKTGFVNEGLSKKLLKVNGIWEDHYRYTRINE